MVQNALEEVFALKKYRIKFSKFDKMIFIGHLDLLTIFQRAIKRANLPIKYSEGFNPHQQVGFACPLSVGLSSECEFVDIQLKEEFDTVKMVECLNEVFPRGLRALEAKEIPEGEKSAAAQLTNALYMITLDREIDNLSDKVKEFLAKESLVVTRVIKKKEKSVDIRGDIFEIEVVDNKTLKTLLSAGSAKNLKVDVFLGAFYDFLGLEYVPSRFDAVRLELLRKIDDKLVSL